MPNTYTEVSLGDASEQALLRRVLENSGYQHSASQTMRGLSGLDHRVDAVGIRGNNLALVFSGPKDIGLRAEKQTATLSPRFKSEIWCRDALLRMYDISAMLEREGLKVDLVFFENCLSHALPRDFDFGAVDAFVQQYGLPKDLHAQWQVSMLGIDVAATRYLSEASQSAGACYLGLNDLTIPEISAICGDNQAQGRDATRAAMSRLRVDQYFNPPADELILTALALSRRQDPAIIQDVYRASVTLDHKPVANAIVPEADYTDPVATAIALSDIGAIEYSGEVRLQENGREIVHRVSKTAQENFVIRALKAVDMPGTVKAIIQGFRGGG